MVLHFRRFLRCDDGRERVPSHLSPSPAAAAADLSDAAAGLSSSSSSTFEEESALEN